MGGWVDEAWRLSGMERGLFVETLAQDVLLQETLHRSLELVLKTAQEKKRRMAAYVLADAVAGRLDIDQSRMLIKTVDVFEKLGQAWERRDLEERIRELEERAAAQSQAIFSVPLAKPQANSCCQDRVAS